LIREKNILDRKREKEKEIEKEREIEKLITHCVCVPYEGARMNEQYPFFFI
jgi:hypothetical protein